MTRDRYLEMMEQLGKEPEEDEIPPDWEDLPDIIYSAVSTYNVLGDREIMHWLDTRAIKSSSEQLKKEYDKLKRKK